MGLYDKNLPKDVLAYGKRGAESYDYGKTLTEEGIGGLRKQYGIFEGRLKDPLGDVGRGIFSRARGAISDDAIRSQRGFAFKNIQRALQSGGTMSPEALAELDVTNQRNIDETRFGAERDLGIAEADLTLTETSKLFDRMGDISKTMTVAGGTEKLRGLETILNALHMRWDKDKTKRQILGNFASALIGGAASGASGGGGGGYYGGYSQQSGGGNPWGTP